MRHQTQMLTEAASYVPGGRANVGFGEVLHQFRPLGRHPVKVGRLGGRVPKAAEVRVSDVIA